MVHTRVYEGPLELLLYLVKRDSIDLGHLPLSHITGEYLAYLDQMRHLDLDLAGEFLVMAATLCELKSRELLPSITRSVSTGDEEQDPREALALRILEYQRYREAAETLLSRPILGKDVFCREPKPIAHNRLGIHTGTDITGFAAIYYQLLHKRSSSPPTHHVKASPVNWQESLSSVLDLLEDGQAHGIDELFAALPTRTHRIFAFLAVLELCRQGYLDIRQEVHLAPMIIEGRQDETTELPAAREAT